MPKNPIPPIVSERLKAYSPSEGKIDLSKCYVNGTAFRRVLRHLAQLPGLRTLDVSWNDIGEDEAHALAESKHLSCLQILHIDNNCLREKGTEALVASKYLSNLHTLDIGANYIGEKGAMALAAAALLSGLHSLNVRRNEIRKIGAEALATSDHLSGLCRLSVRANDICPKGAQSLAASEYLSGLHTLDIGFNQIGNKGAIALAASRSLSRLHNLELDDNQIGDEGAKALALSEHLSGLQRLNLHSNQIRDEGAYDLALSRHLTCLSELDISENEITDPQPIIDLCAKMVPIVLDNGKEWAEICVERNPICWPGADAPISQITLLESAPIRLRQLLLNSRSGEKLLAARATMIGLGMSGKTRLSRWLVDHPKKREDIDHNDRTVGIEPLETTIRGTHPSQFAMGEVTLTVLDCGGQQEQLQSHHNLVYKAAGRSLFLLCLHAGKDFRSREGNRADYYLRMLQSYCAFRDPPLPVLIVVTHGELTGPPERKLRIPEKNELSDQYPQLRITKVDPYFGREGIEISDVRGAIAEFLSDMKQIRSILPKGIRKLQAEIKKEFQLDEALPPDPREMRIKCASMSPEEFGEACNNCGLKDESSHLVYLRHLASLGTVIAPGIERALSADSKPLDSVVSQIFNPRYINQYVYGLLMNNRVRETCGFMSAEHFYMETTRLSEEQKNVLRSLLKTYLVAFEWKQGDEEGLLIPDLLPERAIPAKWDDSICQTTLHFNVRRVFLGEHRFFEFLSRQKNFIKPLELNEAEADLPIRPIGVFRNEVRLRRESSEALVQIDVIESRIYVAVRGGTMEDAGHLSEQIIGTLTYLDPPDAIEIERWQTNSTKPGPKRAAVGKGKYDLVELQKRIEEWVERHGFPWPQKALSDRFRCPENSLSVIVNRSDTLKAARDLQKLLFPTGGRKHQGIEGAVLDGTRNFNAPDPDNEAAVQEQYDLMRKFSREQILSELCNSLPTVKKRQDLLKLTEHQTTEFLRRTLAVHRVNLRGT